MGGVASTSLRDRRADGRTDPILISPPTLSGAGIIIAPIAHCEKLVHNSADSINSTPDSVDSKPNSNSTNSALSETVFPNSTDSANSIPNSNQDILKEANLFYKNLYITNNPTATDIEKYLADTNLTRSLTDDEKDICEGRIQLVEIENVIKKLKCNKSPGLDGLSSEFYQTFLPIVGKLLVDVYNEALETGMLSCSQRQSVLSLIFKKGDREKLTNYRPISITTTDYKILAHTLANRLHNILRSIISTAQAGYVKNRFIGNNIRLVQDVIENAKKSNTRGLLLFLDFEIAFDSIEHEFMIKTLRKFNFGETFIKWIQTLYHKSTSYIKNNGYISEGFEATRGVKPGCPLSALLFILVVEILALRIKQNKEIKAIT